jgi:hypothetical protein
MYSPHYNGTIVVNACVRNVLRDYDQHLIVLTGNWCHCKIAL